MIALGLIVDAVAHTAGLRLEEINEGFDRLAEGRAIRQVIESRTEQGRHSKAFRTHIIEIVNESH